MTTNPNVQQDFLKEKVRKRQILKHTIEQIEKRQQDELKPLKELFEKLDQQIMGFMQQLGIRFTKTEFGDPGIYTKSSYSVEDQDTYKRHVIGAEDWDLLVWAVRRTSAEAFHALHGAYPPGVKVTKEQKLRVTAPTPLGRKRTPKKTEVQTGETLFDPFENPIEPLEDDGSPDPRPYAEQYEEARQKNVKP